MQTKQPANPAPAVVTQEIRVVDDQGRPRIVLSTLPGKDGAPTLALLREDGQIGASVRLDSDGRPAVSLSNPNATWPSATLEIDGKGAHVKFDRSGGASAYLFLNNTGGSGVVLIDNAGKRKLDAVVAADGTSRVQQLDDDGKPLPVR